MGRCGLLGGKVIRTRGDVVTAAKSYDYPRRYGYWGERVIFIRGDVVTGAKR